MYSEFQNQSAVQYRKLKFVWGSQIVQLLVNKLFLSDKATFKLYTFVTSLPKSKPLFVFQFYKLRYRYNLAYRTQEL